MSIFIPFKALWPVVTQNASSTEGGSTLWLCSREDISQSREGSRSAIVRRGNIEGRAVGSLFLALDAFFLFFFLF